PRRSATLLLFRAERPFVRYRFSFGAFAALAFLPLNFGNARSLLGTPPFLLRQHPLRHQAPRVVAVEHLGTRRLDFDLHAGGHMLKVDGARRLVDLLATRTAGAHELLDEVFF